MHFLHMAWLNFKGQRAAFNLEEFLLLETLYPFLTLVFYCVMAGYAYQTSNVTDWVVGNSFLLCTNICVFSLGSCFVGERYYGRIRSIMVGTKSKIVVVLEKGFVPAFVSILTTLFGFVAGCMCFHVPLDNIPVISLVITFVIAMFAAMSFGLFLSVLGLVTDQMHIILNLTQYALLILTGANFQIEQLPKAFEIVAYMLPLTRSIKATRMLMSGELLPNVIDLLVGEMLVGLCYIALATVIVKGVEKIAIKKGTLELF